MTSLIPLEAIIQDDSIEVSEKLEKLCSTLTDLARLMVTHASKLDVTQCNILHELAQFLLANPNLKTLNEFLALLRNSAATSRRSRELLIKNDLNIMLINTVVIACSERSDEILMSRRRFLQYLGNLVGDVEDNSAIWQATVVDKSKIFLSWINSDDSKVSLYAAFTLRNLSKKKIPRLLELTNFVEYIETLISTVVTHENEWSLLILENVIETENFLEVFEQLSSNCQLFMLDLICEKLSHSDEDSFNYPKNLVPYSVSFVKENLDKIRIKKIYDDFDNGLKFIKILTLLAHFSLDAKHSLNSDLELLIMCVECLKIVHEVGKSGIDGFDPKSDFESLAGNKSEIFEHPLFGLKRDLVRLIGNLAHNHKLNQDTVRDFQGIELLLDSSSLDARNPYITQWVVLAIRNLLEGNPENQKIVSELTKKGDDPKNPVMRELNFEYKL